MSDNNSNSNNNGMSNQPIIMNAAETTVSAATANATSATITMQNNRLFEAVTNKEAFIHELMEAKAKLMVELAEAKAYAESLQDKLRRSGNSISVYFRSIFNGSDRTIETDSKEESTIAALNAIEEKIEEAYKAELAEAPAKVKELTQELNSTKLDAELAAKTAEETLDRVKTAHARELANVKTAADNRFNDTIADLERKHGQLVEELNAKITRLDAGNKFATMEEEIASLQLELAKRDSSFITINWKALLGKK